MSTSGAAGGKQKIQELTNAWYAFAALSAALALLSNGIGIVSLFVTACTTAFSFCLTWFLGRRLLARSSLTRSLLAMASVVGLAVGIVGVWGYGRAFFSEWTLVALVSTAASTGSVAMNWRSFRTLTDGAVKAYVKG